MINEFIKTNSFVHRINPTVKIVIFGILIIATFLPFGFTWQLITLAIIHIFWFLGKLKWKTYKKTFITFFIMLVFLFIINWMSYKDPGVSFLIGGKDNIISPKWWWEKNSSSNLGTFVSDGNNFFLAGSIFFGNNVGGINGLESDYSFINKIGDGHGFYSMKEDFDSLKNITLELSNKGYTLINGPTQNGVHYFYVYNSQWYSVSSYGLTLAIFITIKIFSTILIVNLLTSTTSPVELTYGFNEILYPLSYLKLPVNELAMILTLSIRFIPSLLEESSRVLKAQASRGLDIRRGKFIDKSKALISLLIPMFAISFRKAEELANAMEARAYNPRIDRSRYRNFSLKLTDYGILIFIGIFFGMTCFFSLSHSIGNITFLLAPMGIYDAIILLI